MMTESIGRITRRIEFDAGHRIPSHKSKCRNVHGHRYVMFATVQGIVKPTTGQSDDGMVTDFSDLKSVMMEVIGEPWDHAFLCSVHDEDMVRALRVLGPDQKVVYLPCVPTAENLAKQAFERLDAQFKGIGSEFSLVRVRLYETPNCYCDYPA